MIDVPDPPSAGGSIGYKIAIGVALLCGAAMCAGFGDPARWSAGQLAPFVIAILLGLLPPVRRAVLGVMEKTRRSTPRGRAMTSIILFFVAFAALILPPLLSGRALYPRSHDEQISAVMAQMLAHGRLWMPAHPLGEFFDSFFMLTRGVYAVGYFPGGSLLLTPTLWLHLPYWLLPVTYGALAVAFLYASVTKLIDGSAGLLSALLLLANTDFRVMALVWMPHDLMLMLGIVAIWAWLAWLNQPRWGWALLAGVIAGLAAITRPIDALCYLFPLALAALPTWARLGIARRASTVGWILIGAAPFVALQLAFNVGVTGRISETPYQLYLQRDQPDSGFGFFPYNPTLWPESNLLQKDIYYDQFIRPELARHRPDQVWNIFVRERLGLMLRMLLAHPLLAILLPVSLLGLCDLRRIAVWSVMLWLTGAYMLFAFLLEHYLVVWLAPVVFAIVLGADVLVRGFPRQRWLGAMIPLLLLAAIISGQAPLNPSAVAPWKTPLMDDVHRQLAHLPHLPAVVLFRYDPRTGIGEEPVYNYQAPWPDDEPIVRAHDLGPENAKIVDYYARIQPKRFFYRYDRLTRTLQPLGFARDLAREIRAHPSSAPTSTNAPTSAPDAIR